MDKPALQKIKLLYLWELLKRESDEFHPLRTHALLELMEQEGISCDRRTLAKDIADLNHWGFEVMIVQCGHEKGYYVADRAFSVPELRILIDAVQASNFITPGKTETLTAKLASLNGHHGASRLQQTHIPYNRRKRSNESVYYNVDTIENALSENKQISFLYFDLDTDHRKIYRLQKTRFTAEPLGLVLSEDRYYLAALSPLQDGIKAFRIDRMEDVRIEDTYNSPSSVELRKTIPDYAARAFKMFSGKETPVTLQFHSSMTGSIYDRFGERVSITSVSEEWYQITVPVQISPTFWGWLFQYGDRIRITDPPEAIEAAKQFIAKLPYFKEEAL